MSPELQKIMFRDGPMGLLISPFYLLRSSLYKAIKKIAPSFHGKILDLGCGSKPYEHLFVECSSYIGLDMMQSGHDHKNSKVDIYFDGGDFPFQDGEFDCVVTFEVFEHVFDLSQTLQQIHRVLKPGGRVLATVPFAWPEHEQPYDFARYTSFGIAHLMTHHGFVNIGVDKTGNHFMVIGQLMIEYLRQIIYPQDRIGRSIANLFIGFPISFITKFLSFFAPKRTDIYFNCVITAEKGI